MVLAVEPAFYAAGFGGIRLEHVFVGPRRGQRDPDPSSSTRCEESPFVEADHRQRPLPAPRGRRASRATASPTSSCASRPTTAWSAGARPCSGADAASVEAAVRAMAPFVIGRDPWNREAMRADLFQLRPLAVPRRHGQLRLGRHRHGARRPLRPSAAASRSTACSAGCRRSEVSYFYYLARGDDDDLAAQCARRARAGLRRLLPQGRRRRRRTTSRMVADAARGARRRARGCGSTPTAAGRVPEALRHARADGRARHRLRRAAGARPPDRPAGGGAGARCRWRCARTRVCGARPTRTRASARAQADVYCFSPTGSARSRAFHRLAHVAHLEGLQVCKHTHGELGLAAAACQHVLLTLPNVVEGHQQTAHMMAGDVLASRCRSRAARAGACRRRRAWASRSTPDAVAEAAGRYRSEGQYLPWQPYQLGREDRA